MTGPKNRRDVSRTWQRVYLRRIAKRLPLFDMVAPRPLIGVDE